MRKKTRKLLADYFKPKPDIHANRALREVFVGVGKHWKALGGLYHPTTTNRWTDHIFGPPKAQPETNGNIVFRVHDNDEFSWELGRMVAARPGSWDVKVEPIANPLIYDKVEGEWMTYEPGHPELVIDPKDAILEWLVAEFSRPQLQVLASLPMSS